MDLSLEIAMSIGINKQTPFKKAVDPLALRAFKTCLSTLCRSALRQKSFFLSEENPRKV